MAVIRVLEAISAGFGVVWQRGETQDVSDDLARLLVTQRRAEYVSPPAAPADWLVPVMKKVDEAADQSSVSGAGSVTIDATRASQSLTDAEQQAQQLVFTGSLAADVTFDVGALRRRRVVDNQTTGAGRLLLKFGPSGSAFAVPQNEMVEVQ